MLTQLTRWNSSFKVRGVSSFKRKNFKGQTPDSVGKHHGKAPLRGRSIKPLGKRMKRTRRGLEEARWSKEVRERDNYICQFPGCFKGGKSIDTHHIAPRSLRLDLKFVVSNGVALCRGHHRHVHANRDEAVAMGLLNLESYELAQKKKARAA